MLAAIGVARIEDLFADVPAHVRFPELKLPPPASELDIAREMQALAARNFAVDPSLVVPRRRHLSAFPAGDRRLRAFPRRVLHLLHAVPAGGEPGHAAGAVRIPEHDLPAHRHGGEQRQPLRRRDRAGRGGAARAQCGAGQTQQDHPVAGRPPAIPRGRQDLPARHACGDGRRRRGWRRRSRSAQVAARSGDRRAGHPESQLLRPVRSRRRAWPMRCTAPARCSSS